MMTMKIYTNGGIGDAGPQGPTKPPQDEREVAIDVVNWPLYGHRKLFPCDSINFFFDPKGPFNLQTIF